MILMKNTFYLSQYNISPDSNVPSVIDPEDVDILNWLGHPANKPLLQYFMIWTM